MTSTSHQGTGSKDMAFVFEAVPAFEAENVLRLDEHVPIPSGISGGSCRITVFNSTKAPSLQPPQIMVKGRLGSQYIIFVSWYAFPFIVQGRTCPLMFRPSLVWSGFDQWNNKASGTHRHVATGCCPAAAGS